jgi:hypothetical protein
VYLLLTETLHPCSYGRLIHFKVQENGNLTEIKRGNYQLALNWKRNKSILRNAIAKGTTIEDAHLRNFKKVCGFIKVQNIGLFTAVNNFKDLQA